MEKYDWYKRLQSQDDNQRLEAAKVLAEFLPDAEIEELLLVQLAVEKKLYPRIAICETLQTGDINTARRMIAWLGVIGTNQHTKLPERVSAKKSYPLPRDIVARAMAKMRPEVFPALQNAFLDIKPRGLSELLDAAGWMIFYHRELACAQVLAVASAAVENTSVTCGDFAPVLFWKLALFMSGFSAELAQPYLHRLESEYSGTVIEQECRRSRRLF